MFYIRKFLCDESIEAILKLKDYLQWTDGLVSFPSKEKEVKNCQQAISSDFLNEIQRIVYHNLDNDREFWYKINPKKSSSIMFARYSEGMYFAAHHDDYSYGDYSTTLFLSEDFEGGELNLWNDGEIKKIKLPIGWAVTYDTGTCHAVSEVTKGKRDVILFWSTSWIRDVRVREMYGKLKKSADLVGNMQDKYNIPISKTVEEAKEDPNFLIGEILRDIERQHFS